MSDAGVDSAAYEAWLAAKSKPPSPEFARRANGEIHEGVPREAQNGVAIKSDVVSIRKSKTTADAPINWKDRLVYRQTDEGLKLQPITANAIVILQGDETWMELLFYDLFAQGVRVREGSTAPWDGVDAPAAELDDGVDRSGAWRETDAVRLQAWFARHYGLFLTPRQCYDAALTAAESRAANPLRVWLDTQVWGCVPRVDRWLTTYLGVPDTPYARLVGRLFLVSCVARAYQPGCKVDTMLVLEGPQGKFKSTAARVLAGDAWYSDTPIDFSSKDRFLALRSVWIQEVPELDGMGRAEVARVKSFLSSSRDDFRRPYGAQIERVPRRSVLIGTVNPEGGGGLGYFRDPTGMRRAWPVTVGTVNIPALVADREQIWAEAVTIYRGKAGDEDLAPGLPSPGTRWYASTPAEHALCDAEQEERQSVDPWQGPIQDYLDARPPGASVTIREVLLTPCGVELPKQGKAEQTRAGLCIAASRWAAVSRALEPPRPDGKPPKKERLYRRIV